MDRKRVLYISSLILIFTIAIILRVEIADTTREIIIGDETTYHHAAKNLIKHGTITFDMNGDIFHGKSEVIPTSKLQPGYPIYIALIYTLFGHTTNTVLISQIILSILSLWLIFKTLDLLKIRKLYIIISLILATIYPGFLYNIDRMLTEQLFTTLILSFAYFFLRSIQNNNVYLLGISGAFLTCATHVRALAFPFVVVAIFILFVYERQNKRNMIKNLAVFIGVIILCMLPWWIRNWITFDRFMLFTEAGIGPKIWGAVPYFIDMASTSNLTLDGVLQNNITSNPSVYYQWRVFGFFQYMWGDLWDEKLVHPYKYLRPFIGLQQVIIVPCIITIPFLLRKCSKEVLFLSCFPLAFTLMNMPYHGLPRYVSPSVPFVIILVAVSLEKLIDAARKKQKNSPTEMFLYNWQKTTDRWLRCGYIVFATFFSAVLFFSVYVFAYGINGEMSEYRLSRYMGITQKQLQTNEIISTQKFDPSKITIENSGLNDRGKYKNDVNAPAIIKVNGSLTNESYDKKIVTEVNINIQGGYLFDYMTVYWTGRKTEELTENAVYKFPINLFEKSQKIYIDDDVESLMIVPAVFRGGVFDVNYIEIKKYGVPE